MTVPLILQQYTVLTDLGLLTPRETIRRSTKLELKSGLLRKHPWANSNKLATISHKLLLAVQAGSASRAVTAYIILLLFALMCEVLPSSSLGYGNGMQLNSALLF